MVHVSLTADSALTTIVFAYPTLKSNNLLTLAPVETYVKNATDLVYRLGDQKSCVNYFGILRSTETIVECVMNILRNKLHYFTKIEDIQMLVYRLSLQTVADYTHKLC